MNLVSGIWFFWPTVNDWIWGKLKKPWNASYSTNFGLPDRYTQCRVKQGSDGVRSRAYNLSLISKQGSIGIQSDKKHSSQISWLVSEGHLISAQIVSTLTDDEFLMEIGTRDGPELSRCFVHPGIIFKHVLVKLTKWTNIAIKSAKSWNCCYMQTRQLVGNEIVSNVSPLSEKVNASQADCYCSPGF